VSVEGGFGAGGCCGKLSRGDFCLLVSPPKPLSGFLQDGIVGRVYGGSKAVVVGGSGFWVALPARPSCEGLDAAR
jgi:hypothetical protein